ncbi:MAG: TraB/GumN family protein [Gammaproteobacteria bacterium]|nr:TraB/GumN family protein [Gammaproteobacteria bacterium]
MRSARLVLGKSCLLVATTLIFSVALLPALHAASATRTLPLWKVEGSNNRIYLLGSVHMLRESDHPLPAAMYEAYADSDALIMEIDITAIDPVATQAMVNELGLIKGGKQLGDLLGEKDYAEAQRLAESINIPLSMLASAEPWFAAITIDSLMLMRIGFSPANGVEMRFAESAAVDGKAVSGFETERQQLEMLDGLSPQAQRDLLLQTLAESTNVVEIMDDLIEAWRRGDTKRLEDELLTEIKRYPEIYQAIVVRRNENWIEQIVELLDDRQNYLIIVGTMHMIGESGLPALLKEKGHVAVQMHQPQ